jgi:hypothetical protein
MKVLINQANENWICDRMRSEFYNERPEYYTSSINDCDISWLIAPWATPDLSLLSEKKNIFSIYHIVPEKFNYQRLIEMDSVATAFHTICNKTKQIIQKYVSKPVFMEPFWINQRIFHPLSKLKCVNDLSLPEDKFIIGSFQRDTEGYDLKTPKLEKGPDVFCDIVEKISKNKDVHVLLGGWRRQYIINRLNKSSIPYTYIELADFKTLNKMYNSLDLYIVSSRYEGGPQAIPECSITKTPIISTDVGCADFYLNPNSIIDNTNYEDFSLHIDFSYEKALSRSIPNGINHFIKMFNNVNNL